MFSCFSRSRDVLIVGLDNTTIALCDLAEKSLSRSFRPAGQVKTRPLQTLEGHEANPEQLVLNDNQSVLFSLSSKDLISWSTITFSKLKRVSTEGIHKIIPIGDTLLAAVIFESQRQGFSEPQASANNIGQDANDDDLIRFNDVQFEHLITDEKKVLEPQKTIQAIRNVGQKSIQFWSQKDFSALFFGQSKLLDKVDDVFFVNQPTTLVMQRKKRLFVYPLNPLFAMSCQSTFGDCAVSALFYAPQNDLFYVHDALPEMSLASKADCLVPMSQTNT